MKKLSAVIAFIGLAALTGCETTTNEQRVIDAGDLVRDLGSNYYVAKGVTKVTNYSVILNRRTSEYFAIDLSGFSNGMDADQYVRDQFARGRAEGDLRDLRNGDYQAPDGTVYSKSQNINLDLATVALLNEKIKIAIRAQGLSEEFGLSASRATAVAKVVTAFQKNQAANKVKIQDVEGLSRSTLGVSLSQLAKAQTSPAELAALTETIASVNGVSPAQVRKALTLKVVKKALSH